MPKVARDKVAEALRQSGAALGITAKDIEGITRRLLPAIDLVPMSGKGGWTRAGGYPDLPDDVAWPRTEGAEPMPFMLQVDLVEVARFDVGRVLPSAGLLSFFFYTFDEDSGEEGKVFWFPDLAGLKQRRPPKNLPSAGRYRSVPLSPRLEWTLPDRYTLDLDSYDTFWRLRQAAVTAQGLLPVNGDSFQLLGHQSVIQEWDLQEGQLLLMQANPDYGAQEEAPGVTGMNWGDGGQVYFVLPAEDLKARVFDRIEVVLDMC
jgi:hypothetical protein